MDTAAPFLGLRAAPGFVPSMAGYATNRALGRAEGLPPLHTPHCNTTASRSLRAYLGQVRHSRSLSSVCALARKGGQRIKTTQFHDAGSLSPWIPATEPSAASPLLERCRRRLWAWAGVAFFFFFSAIETLPPTRILRVNNKTKLQQNYKIWSLQAPGTLQMYHFKDFQDNKCT